MNEPATKKNKKNSPPSSGSEENDIKSEVSDNNSNTNNDNILTNRKCSQQQPTKQNILWYDIETMSNFQARKKVPTYKTLVVLADDTRRVHIITPNLKTDQPSSNIYH